MAGGLDTAHSSKDSFQLGWKINDRGEYRLSIPKISKEEETLIIAVEEAFREKTRHQVVQNSEESISVIKNLISAYAKEHKTYIDSDQTDYLSRIARMHIYGFCFIDELLTDKEIEEISIIGTDKPAYVYLRSKGWKKVNASFTNESTIADVVNKMAHTIGRRITLQNPRIDAMLSNGDRLHASLSPISNGEITIRRFKETPFSPKELCDNKTINERALAYLSLVLQSDSSLILAGNTASGKTSMLNALFSFVPFNERVIITEETPEITILHPHTIRLVANKDMGISLSHLVYDSFRMRPDRMIVGEIRNEEEARALFEVLLAGQARGSYATMHGQSVTEALQRLRTFGIEQQDINSIDCMIVQKRMVRYDRKKKINYEIRRVIEIAEILGDRVHPVFSYDYATDTLKESESVLLEEIGSKLGLRKKEIDEELVSRTNIIKKNTRSYEDYFKYIQKEFYGLSYEFH